MKRIASKRQLCIVGVAGGGVARKRKLVFCRVGGAHLVLWLFMPQVSKCAQHSDCSPLLSNREFAFAQKPSLRHAINCVNSAKQDDEGGAPPTAAGCCAGSPATLTPAETTAGVACRSGACIVERTFSMSASAPPPCAECHSTAPTSNQRLQHCAQGLQVRSGCANASRAKQTYFIRQSNCSVSN